MKMSTFLPTYTDYPAEQRLPMMIRWARRAEELGFSGLWTVDHILRIEGNPTYADIGWLDPFQCLAYVSSHAKLPVGTIYCGILREPVLAAKEIATLMYLTEGRFILSPVLGWMDREFEVAGFSRATRGRRMDEWLAALDLLLTQERASFDGEFYSFHGVTIDPLPRARPTVIVTGGGAGYEPDAVQDEPSLKPKVIDRILRYDGWCVSAQSSPKKSEGDWKRLADAARARGEDPSRLHVSQTNFVHVVDTADRQKAYEVQAPLWNARRTIDATFEELSDKGVYMTGTIDDIVEKLRIRKEAFGMQEFMANVHPGQEDEQLELWARHLLPAIADL